MFGGLWGGEGARLGWLELGNRGKQSREHGMITNPVSCAKNEETGAKLWKKREIRMAFRLY